MGSLQETGKKMIPGMQPKFAVNEITAKKVEDPRKSEDFHPFVWYMLVVRHAKQFDYIDTHSGITSEGLNQAEEFANVLALGYDFKNNSSDLIVRIRHSTRERAKQTANAVFNRLNAIVGENGFDHITIREPREDGMLTEGADSVNKVVEKKLSERKTNIQEIPDEELGERIKEEAISEWREGNFPHLLKRGIDKRVIAKQKALEFLKKEKKPAIRIDVLIGHEATVLASTIKGVKTYGKAFSGRIGFLEFCELRLTADSGNVSYTFRNKQFIEDLSKEFNRGLEE
ncbi:hypothetical protein C4559_04275 [Candidatus Microgenomates bacterium]|nr:MAG: hypothetical protein C4559_04275 [Candidatus Microgenomates bacterium]